MSAAAIEEMHTMRVKDLTHERLVCEVAIYTFPVWARVQGAPEIKLKSVVFELNGRVGEGVEVFDARDHAVFLAQFRRDKRERLSWPDIERECAEIYFDGMSSAVERDIDHGDEVKSFAGAAGGDALAKGSGGVEGHADGQHDRGDRSSDGTDSPAHARSSVSWNQARPAATFLDGRAA